MNLQLFLKWRISQERIDVYFSDVQMDKSELDIIGLDSYFPRDRVLSVTCEGQLSLEGSFWINDIENKRIKNFRIFKKKTD